MKDKTINKLENYLKNNLVLIICTTLCVFLAYGYEMSNFALTIDEEANWARTSLSYFLARISDGRFTLGFSKLLFPRVFLPFWSTALFSIIMVINGCLLTYVFKEYITSKMAQIAFSCVFVTFPVHAYYIMFSNMSAETAISYTLTILAVYFVTKCIKEKRINWKYIILSGVFVVTSNGVYQAFFCVYIILVCIYSVLMVLSNNQKENQLKDSVRFWISHAGILFSYGIIYLCVTKLLQIFSPSRAYVESFIQWGKMSVWEIIRTIVQSVMRIILSQGNDHAYITMKIIFLFFVTLFVIGIFKCKGVKKIIFLIAMLGAFGANFLMMVVAGNGLPERTFLTLPLYAGFVLALMIEKIDIKKLNFVYPVCIVAILLVQTANITDLFWAETRREESDQAQMVQLTQMITEASGAVEPVIPVVFVGETIYSSYDSSFGYSYFNLVQRIYGYLSYYGYDYIRGSNEQMETAKEIALDMPNFPETGSVKEEQGMIVVKLNSN